MSAATYLPISPVYVLDTSAILRYLDRQAGWPRVHSILDECSTGQCKVMVSAINWAELATKLYRQHGQSLQAAIMTGLLSLRIEIIPATADRAVRSGILKAQLSISYADSFGVELASDSPNHTLVTADYGVKPAISQINIEFLPTK